MTLPVDGSRDGIDRTLNAPQPGGASATCTPQAASNSRTSPRTAASPSPGTALPPTTGSLGSLTYTANCGRGTGPFTTWLSATANSVLVSPVLQFTTTIGTFPASCLIANTGIVAEQSDNLGGDEQYDADHGHRLRRDHRRSGVEPTPTAIRPQDSGEGGIAGVRVYIDANGNSQYDSGETNAFTDVNGFYQFTGLAAATYTVRTDPSTYPAGYQPTTPAFVTQAVAANGSNLNFDFGMQPAGAGSIGDFVWLDTNRDGIADPASSRCPASPSGSTAI